MSNGLLILAWDYSIICDIQKFLLTGLPFFLQERRHNHALHTFEMRDVAWHLTATNGTLASTLQNPTVELLASVEHDALNFALEAIEPTQHWRGIRSFGDIDIAPDANGHEICTARTAKTKRPYTVTCYLDVFWLLTPDAHAISADQLAQQPPEVIAQCHKFRKPLRTAFSKTVSVHKESPRYDVFL